MLCIVCMNEKTVLYTVRLYCVFFQLCIEVIIIKTVRINELVIVIILRQNNRWRILKLFSCLLMLPNR